MTDAQTHAQTLFSRARAAQSQLAVSTLSERLAELGQLQQRIHQQRDQIADRIVADTGKSRTDALVSELLGVLDYLQWLQGAAPAALADEKVSTPLALMGKSSRIWYEALGVVLVITPWNYPFHIAMTAIAPAFAAGNAVVLKPSEHTPLTGLIESLVDGLPLLSAALQIAQGAGEMAEALIAQRPDRVSFTGSARTGRRILAQCAPLLVPVDLELGGKDAMLVFEDVDLERTSAGALWGALTNGGQSCTAVERLYVHQSRYPEMVSRLRDRLDALVVCSGDTGNADIGAMTTDFQLEIVQRHLADAAAKGATIHGGGRIGDTRMLRPALVTDVRDDMLVVQEETFGPILVVQPFQDEQDSIRLANSTPFGLSASVWSKDLARAERVARALRVGAVSINNVMLTEGNPALPFGGVGESGYGRAKGVEGLRGMVRSKAVLIDKQSSKIEANWFPYTQEKFALFGGLIDGLFGRGLGRWVTFAKAGLKLEKQAQLPRSNGSDQ
ncbi:aldehyde dehydrogenase family protein [Isoalcanivorax beigongshangi]|uniref:Aldehyde dehydrogenase n=1 Tax=Isoalcanivorax beigongshangi TaxID=3238810 RepID=A0ABV4AGY2_9GAMM